MRPEFLVLGNFVVDLIAQPVERLPERGQLLEIATLETHPGGNAPNTAGALARLGASVAVLGRVGEDLYGRFLLERLATWGVATEGVRHDPERATGLTWVVVDPSGERSFLHHFGANAAFDRADVEAANALGTGARHLHYASFFVLPALDGAPAAELLAEARRRGLTTSLDLCWDRTGRWMERLRPCLAEIDLLLPSEAEARRLTGRERPAEIVAALHDAGSRTVLLKLGERGCYYSGPEGRLAVPAYRVAVRETTGAGDCFAAGFLYARLQGWDLERALRFANACGARSVAAVGAVTGLAPAEEIERWAARQPFREEMP